MCIKCHRCGEELTAPYFHNGNPYGYTCIKIVNPVTKKKKDVGQWTIADSHDFTTDTDVFKQQVTAFCNGKKYKFFAFKCRDTGIWFADSLRQIGSDNTIYILITH